MIKTLIVSLFLMLSFQVNGQTGTSSVAKTALSISFAYTEALAGNALPSEQLLWAAYSGDTVLAALAIKNGACINTQDQDKNTPLMLSAYNGHTAVVSFLIQQNANVEMMNSWGNTALMLASVNGKAEAADLLIHEGGASKNRRNCRNGYTSVMWASEFGHVDVLKVLLQHNCRVDKRNYMRETALMVAADCGKKDAVELLVRSGACPNKKNRSGMTALMLAQEKGHNEIVEYLKRAGGH